MSRWITAFILCLAVVGKAFAAAPLSLVVAVVTLLACGTGDRSELDIHDTAGLTRYAIAAGVIESPST
jgi:hypothetical protein